MDRVAAAHEPRRPQPRTDRSRREQPARFLFEELQRRGGREQFAAEHLDRRPADVGINRREEVIGTLDEQCAQAADRVGADREPEAATTLVVRRGPRRLRR